MVGTLASVVLLGACAGGDSGPRRLEMEVRDGEGAISVGAVRCDVADGRQLRARGTAHNGGERTHHVQLTVRFVDDAGTRVEIATDSVSDLERGETARWDVTAYSDAAGDATSCEVSARAM